MEIQKIQSKIHHIRGQKVMLDVDLAGFFEVPTKVLKQAVRRNIARFPDDFMFELTGEEFSRLRSQVVTSSWGGNRYAPFAFTEQGVAMIASVLNSETAIQVNIAIVRAFVALRSMAITYDELLDKVFSHDKELEAINDVLKWLGAENQDRMEEIQKLKTKPETWENRPRIGFKHDAG